MKFLDWASYVFLSSEEKSEFKKELRKRRYEREMAMFDRQNLAGGKIGLSLFRDAELEKTRNLIREPGGNYYPTKGNFDDFRPVVTVSSKNLPDNPFIKTEKIRVGLASILRDDVEIRSLNFGELSIAPTTHPHPYYEPEILPGRQFKNVWVAEVKRGESFYCLKIDNQTVTVYPESCQPKIKEYADGYKLADERPTAQTILDSEVKKAPGGEDRYETIVKPMYEYSDRRFKLCGGIEVKQYSGYRAGQGGGSSDLSRREIDLKEYNRLKNQALLAKLAKGQGKGI